MKRCRRCLDNLRGTSRKDSDEELSHGPTIKDTDPGHPPAPVRVDAGTVVPSTGLFPGTGDLQACAPGAGPPTTGTTAPLPGCKPGALTGPAQVRPALRVGAGSGSPGRRFKVRAFTYPGELESPGSEPRFRTPSICQRPIRMRTESWPILHTALAAASLPHVRHDGPPRP